MTQRKSWRELVAMPLALLLLASGEANGQSGVLGVLVSDDVDTRSLTPLALAALSSDAAVAAVLSEGADPNARMDQGMTALHLAVRRPGASAAIRLLIEAGADLTAGETRSGNTPLHAAAWGDSASVQLLVDHGASLTARNDAGRTPLLEAMSVGNAPAFRVLMRAGSDPNGSDESGWTPLHDAAHGQLEADGTSAVSDLLRAGADVNAEDREGRTPLRVALARWRPAQT